MLYDHFVSITAPLVSHSIYDTCYIYIIYIYIYIYIYMCMCVCVCVCFTAKTTHVTSQF